MKNRGVMISLAAMVLIGMIITAGTYWFIETHSGSGGRAGVLSDAAPEAGAGKPEGFSGGGEAQARDAGEGRAAGAGGALAGEEGAAATGVRSGQGPGQDEAGEVPGAAEAQRPEADALLGGGAPKPEEADAFSGGQAPEDQAGAPGAKARMEAAGGEAAVEEEPQSYYVKRLQDLDGQIQKNRDSQTGDGRNSSMKTAASNELKLWDSELNDIYNALLEKLGQEESEALAREERAWLKERDSLAMDAAKNSAGGSSESIEYTLSLVESTRQRAYELAQRFAKVSGE